MRIVLISLAFLCALMLEQGVSAQEKPEGFVRIRKENSKPVALETATAHYVAKDDATEIYKQLKVDLISAVHVGEASYYADLNKLFESYDALLFELIAPKVSDMGNRLKSGETSDSAISMIQVGIKQALQLEFQLEAIDYAKPNMVHADMSPEEFQDSMTQRNESFFKLFMRALAVSYAREVNATPKPPDLTSLLLLFGNTRALALRRLMAAEFEDMEALMETLNGPEGSTLLTERNKVALQVLDQEIKRGKKRIGIFYGGAHLPDMEMRLLKSYPLQLSKKDWFVAWKLS